MSALVMVPSPDATATNDVAPVIIGAVPVGRYDYQQDPDSGAIVQVWIPAPDTDAAEPGIQPVIPLIEGRAAGRRIQVMARGLIDGGIRVAGTTERFASNGIYENVDFVSIKFSADVILTKRDKITDIRNRDGTLLWREEEFDNSATVFDVMGVTPVTDPFGNYIENSALLSRSEVQR